MTLVSLAGDSTRVSNAASDSQTWLKAVKPLAGESWVAGAGHRQCNPW
jgi:hypothetical protein